MEETQSAEVNEEIPFELNPKNDCYWAERDENLNLDADQMRERGLEHPEIRCRFIASSVIATRCLTCRRYKPL